MGKIRSFFFAICFLFAGGTASAQILVKGQVHNQENQPVPSTNVILEDSLGHIKTYTYSDNKGYYRLQTAMQGKMKLRFSSLGYRPATVHLVLKDSTTSPKIINPVLKSKAVSLDEVVLHTEKPIIKRKDTITFKTRFFTDSTEQNVEELLKKIPGVRVLANGTIKVGNQEISKLMIDGDDFFGYAYQLLSKNMPSQPVETVQILKHYSENPLLKGIEDSHEIAINLKLSAKAKRIWFGNIKGGVGNRHFYKASGNLMNFGKYSKYFLLGNLNNIGRNATGDLALLLHNLRKNGRSAIGQDQSAKTLIDSKSPYVIGLSRQKTNFNRYRLLSLNAIFNPTENFKIKPIFFFNKTTTDFYRDRKTVFHAQNTGFTNTEDYHRHFKNRTVFGELELNYSLSDHENIHGTTKFKNGRKNGGAYLLFNGASTRQNLRNRNNFFDQSLNYTDKLADRTVLGASARFIDEKTPQDFKVNRFYFDDVFPQLDSANAVKQYSADQMQYFGGEAHLLHRFDDGSLIKTQLGSAYRIDRLNTVFSIFKDTSLIERPQGFQNHFRYVTGDIYLKNKYKFDLGPFDITARIDFHQLMNTYSEGAIKQRYHHFYIKPKLGLEWAIDQQNTVHLTYAYNHNNTDLSAFYRGFVLSDFQSFSRGAGQFNQLASSEVFLYYQLGNWGDRFFANAVLLYRKNYDFYTTHAVLRQDNAQYEKILVNGQSIFSANAQADYFFDAVSSDLKLTLQYSRSESKNSVNSNKLRPVVSDNFNYGLSFSTSFEGSFNFGIGSTWTTHKMKTNRENTFTDYESFVNLFFKFNTDLNAKLRLKRYHFGRLEQHKNYYFANLQVNYNVFKNKLSVGIIGNNLLNEKKFRNFHISDVSTITTAYKLLPRQLLLTAKYKF